MKGRVVVVGMTGLDIPRQPFYMRELSLTISMSYGPGRYDPDYEEHGHDYPLPYVRWTEKRNIESFLDLVVEKRMDVDRLISHRFPIEEAERAYQLISGDSEQPYLGVVLNYDPEAEVQRRVKLTIGDCPDAKVEGDRTWRDRRGRLCADDVAAAFQDRGSPLSIDRDCFGSFGTRCGKEIWLSRMRCRARTKCSMTRM